MRRRGKDELFLKNRRREMEKGWRERGGGKIWREREMEKGWRERGGGKIWRERGDPVGLRQTDWAVGLLQADWSPLQQPATPLFSLPLLSSLFLSSSLLFFSSFFLSKKFKPQICSSFLHRFCGSQSQNEEHGNLLQPLQLHFANPSTFSRINLQQV